MLLIEVVLPESRTLAEWDEQVRRVVETAEALREWGCSLRYGHNSLSGVEASGSTEGYNGEAKRVARGR